MKKPRIGVRPLKSDAGRNCPQSHGIRTVATRREVEIVIATHMVRSAWRRDDRLAS
jgi:hypothetical protein